MRGRLRALDWAVGYISLSDRVSSDTYCKSDAARRTLLVVKLEKRIDNKGGASQNNLEEEARQKKTKITPG